MADLARRLSFDEAAGEVRDGPRRYLLMRADVLMGAIARLPPASRAQALDALAASVRDNGADSVRAYLAQLDGDASALLATMPAAAADLGWGRWRWEPTDAPAGADLAGAAADSGASASRDPAPLLRLSVRNSPFVAGLRADAARGGRGADGAAPTGADAPACAPIAGMLAAVVQALAGVDASGCRVAETRCAALHGGDECRFEARLPHGRTAGADRAEAQNARADRAEEDRA